MKKRISVEQLKFGVYVNELDRPWTDTPFMYQGFVVQTMQQLQALKKFCKTVVIDTDKGSDVAPQKPGGPVYSGPSVLDEIKVRSTYTETVQVTAEMPAARQAQAKTEVVLKDVFGSVQAGKALDAPRVKEAVSSMTDSVVRNPDAMLLLAKMKETNASAFDRAMGVSIYLITFGRFLSLPRESIDLLGMLGLLQDVGKVRLPQHLLSKREQLTDEERELCKQHVQHSVDILSRTAGLPAQLPALAGLHHERFDGSGYPNGLTGPKIGLFGSMAGLIDSFDALTEPRPYGETLAPAAALRVLYDDRNIKYDGPLVEQFIQCIGTYPVGAIVELHSGEIAVVIARNPRLKLFPRVMVILDIHRNKLKQPKIIEEAGIKRTLPKGSIDIDLSEYFI